ncbi:MAG: GGDEF domain-containing protein [Lachnospiraceae bacterium]|nr:GGDEF domain-containing protein [Lachnospiraceae bacterium]
MERKRIGLFMGEISQFFQKACGMRIIELAHERNMDVFFYTSFGSYASPYGRNLLSEMGKKNIIHLPNYSALDAIIVQPGSFDIYGMDAEFFRIVRKNAKCPVFCLQDGPEDFYKVSVENRDCMYRMTKHFIEEHKFTKICYMSGPFNSKDSPDRLKGFTDAMSEAGLTIHDHSVYEGNYWTTRGEQAMDFFLNGTEDYPEAIICANDYMAISICDALKKRGKRVPEDVCVSGFDGILEGQQNEPSLTTITIRPEDFAEKIFDALDELWAAKGSRPDTDLMNELTLRRSCGCGKQQVFRGYTESARAIRDTDELLREAGKIIADYQNNKEFENSLSVANYYFSFLGCDNGYLCLCDENEPTFKSVEQDKIYSDNMILVQKMNINNMAHAEFINRKFFRSDILPPEYLKTDKPQIYIVYPLYYKNSELGYLILNPALGRWPNALTHLYINALSAAIENYYYQSRFLELSKITMLSQTDALTGIYNRRGFESGLQEIMEFFGKKRISIISIDMDNLKWINDTYGHAEGDFALKKLAEILKSCLKKNEICARFGGDEFSAVLVSDNPGREDEFCKEFDSAMKKAGEESGKSYTLHASVGVCELKGNDTRQIFECMQIADKRMYENKREFKKKLS